MNIHPTKPFLVIIASAFLFLSSHLFADPPTIVNYQGKISQGNTNVNGEVAMEFKIFTGLTNNECVYDETQQVRVVDGLYSVAIGQNPPILGDLAEAAALDEAYLESSIDGQTLTPREKFTPPPFARNADQKWNFWVSFPLTAPPVHFALGGARMGALASFILQVTDATCCPDTAYLNVFPLAPKPVTLKSASVLFANGSFYNPAADPIILIQARARTFTNSVRDLGPVAQFHAFSDIQVNSAWLTLPLSTNQADLKINPGELLCIEMKYFYQTPASKTNSALSDANLIYTLDVRVR